MPIDDAGQLDRIHRTLAAAVEYKGHNKLHQFKPYTKQKEFFELGSAKRERIPRGVSEAEPRIVLVEYKFVSGSDPTVVKAIAQQNWDDAYPS